MFRGTTPSLQFNVNSSLDLSTMEQVWITLENKYNEVTYDINDVTIDADENTIKVNMTQEDTLAFDMNGKLRDKIFAQIRFLDNKGNAYASNEVEIDLKRILKEGVIE